MDLNSVQMFAEIVKEGSFTKAAQKLGIPPSTLSEKISALEAHLKVALLIRTTRKLSLTQAGEIFFARATRGLEELREAGLESSKSHHEAAGLLRITMPAGMATTTIGAYLCRFTVDNPKVNVELTFTDKPNGLIEEKFDLAIRTLPLKQASLVTKVVATTWFHVVASPRYLKKSGILKSPKDLPGHRILIFGDSNEQIWNLENKSGARQKIKLHGQVGSNNLLSLQTMAADGQGLALIPAAWRLASTTRGELVAALPDWTTKKRPVYIAYPRQKFPNHLIEKIIPYIQQSFDEGASDSSPGRKL